MKTSHENLPAGGKVLLTHRVHPSVIERLRAECQIDVNDTGRILPAEEVRRRAGDAAAMMVFMTDHIDRDFLEACPRLRIVAGALKGFDNIDVAACTERGVWVTCVQDLLTVPTAELAIGLLLSLSRNIVAGDRLMRSDPFSGWRPILYGAPLAGRCLGIYGMGAVGQAIAQRMKCFGMRMIYHDPRVLPPEREATLGVRQVAFDVLLAESDHLIVAAPLMPDNLHAFDDGALARMKGGSFLINVGRGSVVDEQAVARSLQSGRLAGFAADVYEMEDRSRSTRPSRIEPSLVGDADRTILTPHLGSAVDSVREQIELEAAENILAALRGQTPPGAVNRPVVNPQYESCDRDA
ncbi:MAG TPA: phosphonate dehydrogenase [Pirellulales bacterium]|jgi:phosphonate dehydrogenase|nr:phosphonate dehydrogenase [Pirellulales bacterium]